MTLVSVQPFGIAAPGGGPRILRALFQGADHPVLNVCTSPAPPVAAAGFEEIHLPRRPRLGRLESTRVNRALPALDLAMGNRFVRSLAAVCGDAGATAVHVIPHSLDFISASRAAEQLGVPLLVSVHDDLRYALRRHAGAGSANRAMRRVWRNADARFVISPNLGDEYCRRYGDRTYEIVTDGVTEIQPARLPRGPQIDVYFAGLFHHSYQPNVDALAAGVSLWRRDGTDVSLTFRCGALDTATWPADVPARVLPFASEAAVADDLTRAGMVYLPLPFDDAHRDFVRFSLSTKLVTYLGSGLPILYHGPRDTAAAQLLLEHRAGIVADTLDPAAIRDQVRAGLRDAGQLVANARQLAAERFTLQLQRERFWRAVDELAQSASPVSA